MSDRAIEIEGVGKRYHLGEDFAGSRYLTLRESLLPSHRRQRMGPKSELWALRDINLHIDRGEILGVIGRNGAGKSTLLKLLARIVEPTTGVMRTRGRVGALLEVGTGFHPELTGRENVFLNASILGMSRREIREKFDAIVDYAGFEEFLDTPLKRFSTGMRLRLAFAVAAHVSPPVIAVDEILAVGDAAFREKCLGTMSGLGEAGRTVVFVSHDLAAVAHLCTRTVWLEHGRVAADGPTAEVVTAYLESRTSTAARVEFADTEQGPVRLLGSQVIKADEPDAQMLTRDGVIAVQAEIEVTSLLGQVDVAFQLVNSAGVLALYEMFSDSGQRMLAREPGRYEVRLAIPPALASDDYTLGIWIGDGNDTLIERDLFTFHLWPGSDDPPVESWRRRVAQPSVSWAVERKSQGAAKYQ